MKEFFEFQNFFFFKNRAKYKKSTKSCLQILEKIPKNAEDRIYYIGFKGWNPISFTNVKIAKKSRIVVRIKKKKKNSFRSGKNLLYWAIETGFLLLKWKSTKNRLKIK